jgi:hypothetical protein
MFTNLHNITPTNVTILSRNQQCSLLAFFLSVRKNQMNLNWKALLIVASLAVGSGLVACDSSTTTPKTGESTAPDTKGDSMKSPEASKSPEAKKK